MRALILPIFILAFVAGSCSAPDKKKDIKPAPEHVGVAEEVRPYFDEFMELSKRKGITFRREVSVGVTKIKRGSVIGLCTFGGEWREVDIDSDFLNENSELRKKILIFHELVHCFCARSHDFQGKPYPGGLEQILDLITIKVKKEIPWCIAREIHGYLPDGCPATIMHPYILDHSCIENHYGYYIDEMLTGCKPW